MSSYQAFPNYVGGNVIKLMLIAQSDISNAN